MTDNNQPDDFSHQDMGGEEAPARAGFGGGLASAWRTKPLFKLLVIMIVVGALVAVVSSFFSDDKGSAVASRVAAPPDMGHQAPGGSVSPYRLQQINEANKSGAEKAIQSGGSFIPTPHGAESDVNEDAKDPLKELRAETEHLKQMVENQQHQPAPAPVIAKPQAAPQQPTQFDNTLAQAMQHEMQQVLTSDWKIKGIHQVYVSKDKDASAVDASGATLAGTNNGASSPPVAPMPPVKTLIPAGTVNYGQLLTEANSDVPGPILAQIVSGHFAGSRAVGEFKVENDYLVLRFQLVNYKGQDYPIEAIALDPDTTLGGMATEVDERYFTRVILPAAAAFLQGLGTSLGQGNTTVDSTGTTTIVTQSQQGFRQGMYQGFGAAATTAGQFFRDQANKTQPLVRIAAGTPIGIFFIRTVTDQQPQQTNLYGQQQPGLPYPQVTNFGQPVAPGFPMQQQSQQGPYGNGPLGMVNNGSSGYGAAGGYGGYGGSSPYAGAYPGGIPGTVPGAVPGYYGR